MTYDSIILSDHIFTAVEGTDGCVSGAIGIRNGRIAAVGAVEEVMADADDHTEIIDATDGFVCPGIVDSHLHFFVTAMNFAPTTCYHYLGTSAQDCVDALKEVADLVPEDEVLYGFGWYHPVWEEPVLPNKALLDAAYPDRPVVYASADAHSLWLNSVALERFGITKDSVPPEGGIYEKDENGELTGIVAEAASMELLGKIFGPSVSQHALDAIRRFVGELNAQGITGVGDMALSVVPGADMIRDDLYGELLESGDLSVRIDMYPTALKDLSRANALREKYPVRGGDMLACRGLKQFFDGVAQLHTAWMIDEYADAPGNFGRPTVRPEDMREIVMHAAENGYAVRIHAIGDKAVRTGLDIFEESQERFGRPLTGRNGLEHIESVKPEDIERFRDLGVMANVQPVHGCVDPDGEDALLGTERNKTAWPFNDYVRQGVSFSLGTDSPVAPTDPRIELFSAVTRTYYENGYPDGGWYPEQRITAVQALRAYTLGGAQCMGREDELGTLEAGKLADIAVFDTDLTSCAPEELLGARTLRTLVGGKTVFSA